VGTRGLGNRVTLEVRRPGAAVRVVLERVQVSRLGAEAEGDLGHLPGGAGMVGRELAALLRLAPAAAARREHDGARFELVLAAARSPATGRRLERGERGTREGHDLRGL